MSWFDAIASGAVIGLLVGLASNVIDRAARAESAADLAAMTAKYESCLRMLEPELAK